MNFDTLLVQTFIERAPAELPNYFWEVEDIPEAYVVAVAYRGVIVHLVSYEQIEYAITKELDLLREMVTVTMETK